MTTREDLWVWAQLVEAVRALDAAEDRCTGTPEGFEARWLTLRADDLRARVERQAFAGLDVEIREAWGHGVPCACAELQDSFPGKFLTDVVQVAGSAYELDVTKDAAYYRCLDCRQWWRDDIGRNRKGLWKVDGPPT